MRQLEYFLAGEEEISRVVVQMETYDVAVQNTVEDF